MSNAVSAQVISLVIKNPIRTDQVHRLTVSLSISVGDLKRLLEETHPEHPTLPSQRLIFAGMLLAKDDAKLSEILTPDKHNLADPQTMHLVINAPQGSRSDFRRSENASTSNDSSTSSSSAPSASAPSTTVTEGSHDEASTEAPNIMSPNPHMQAPTTQASVQENQAYIHTTASHEPEANSQTNFSGYRPYPIPQQMYPNMDSYYNQYMMHPQSAMWAQMYQSYQQWYAMAYYAQQQQQYLHYHHHQQQAQPQAYGQAPAYQFTSPISVQAQAATSSQTHTAPSTVAPTPQHAHAQAQAHVQPNQPNVGALAQGAAAAAGGVGVGIPGDAFITRLTRAVVEGIRIPLILWIIGLGPRDEEVLYFILIGFGVFL